LRATAPFFVAAPVLPVAAPAPALAAMVLVAGFFAAALAVVFAVAVVFFVTAARAGVVRVAAFAGAFFLLALVAANDSPI
jgi:hypothetical protein